VTAHDPGEQRAAIANGIVALFKEHYGRGPLAAKTYFNDDWVFVVLDGGLTRNEQTLVEAGEHDLVRTFRLRFQEAMTAQMTGVVQEVTGRRVVNYHSQLLLDPVNGVEMFLLEPLPDGHGS
jgi:uncharacterized protein YbcI